jgi:hypothetical protein
LPIRVIKEDRSLDAAASRSQEELAKLRWHWTLDESNPKRVGIREYAKAVGRSHTTIRTVAAGYAAWKEASGSVHASRSLNDEIEMAKLGATKQVATEALAKATGKSIGNVASTRRSDIDSVIRSAEHRAERQGTTVEEEIPRAAASHAKTQQHEAKAKADRKAKHTLQYIRLEGLITTASIALKKALDEAADVAFNEEEEFLLRDSIAHLQALLTLIDLRVGGTPDIDWDGELAKIGAQS